MKKVFISGHNGMVGSALIRAFNSRVEEYEIITRNRTNLIFVTNGMFIIFFLQKNQIS